LQWKWNLKKYFKMSGIFGILKSKYFYKLYY
jgi:hypothetical protein